MLSDRWLVRKKGNYYDKAIQILNIIIILSSIALLIYSFSMGYKSYVDADGNQSQRCPNMPEKYS